MQCLYSIFQSDYLYLYCRIHNDDPNAQRLPEVHGALVSRVAPNSPAAASGFRKNDIIVDVNGEKVSNSEDADMRLDKCKPGLISRIRVIRGEPPISIEIQANPMDFCAILEERKMRENLLSGLKPPQQIPQRKMSRKE